MTQHVWALVLLVGALLWVAWDQSRRDTGSLPDGDAMA